MLFLEFHGTEAGVAEQSERFGEIAADLGGGPFDMDDQHRGAHAGSGRRGTTPIGPCVALRPGAQGASRPTCACRSRGSPNASLETQRDIADSGLIAPIVGHVGDGNFHVSLLLDMDDPAEIAGGRGASSSGWSSARSPWRAPAPASTASGRAR